MGVARNVDGETPIFVAALSGSKKAFSTLSSMLTNAEDIALVRRNDGDTILHCAISGEYFGLYPLSLSTLNRLEKYFDFHFLNCFYRVVGINKIRKLNTIQKGWVRSTHKF